jgi:hypothetical protein
VSREQGPGGRGQENLLLLFSTLNFEPGTWNFNAQQKRMGSVLTHTSNIKELLK